MFSLKPKEGAGGNPSASALTAQSNNVFLKAAVVLCLVLIAVIGYSSYTTRTALEARISTLEESLSSQGDTLKSVRIKATDMASDLDVVSKRMGVTAQELDKSRKFAETLQLKQERAQEQLTHQLATKADTTDVAAVRQEATAKLAEVQEIADTKIGSVSGEVKTVAANLDLTQRDLAESRRDITDVRTTLSQQIARNATELADLRKKGERDFFEFDIRKPKKNEMARIADVQLQLKKTDPKRGKYNVLIQVDDSTLEKKDRTANEPVQFLVGRDKLRYEIVVNYVDKDRIRGYLSTPKDKVLAAERPAFRP
jgi:hypothetical protein